MGFRLLAAFAAGLALLPLAGAATAETAELYCSVGAASTAKGDTVACYSDAGCKRAEALGAEPVRDFDVDSAPYALARGKIAAIITSSPQLISKIKSLGGTCRAQ